MIVALVGVVALAAACLQATAGIGFALVLTPVLLLLISPPATIITVTVLGLELNLLVLFAERRRRQVLWREIAPIVLAAVPGTFAGAMLLSVLSRPVLQVGVGVLVILAALVRARRRGAVGTAAAAPAAAEPGPAEARSEAGGAVLGQLALGLATGVLTTSTGVSGPPLALWLTQRGLSPAQLRDSLSASFLAFRAVGALALAPLLPRAHLKLSALLAGTACVLAGHAIGSRVFARLHSLHYEPLLLAVVIVTGVASLLAGATAL